MTRRFQGVGQALLTEIPGSDAQKSSHWQHYTFDREVTEDGQIKGIAGFGAQARRTVLHQFIHSVLQRCVLGRDHPVFGSSSYQNADLITRAQNRALDMDTLRHACTMELLRTEHKRMGAPSVVAVIGDGQSNFVAAALQSDLYGKVVSINLADVLLNDLALIACLPNLGPDTVVIVTDADAMATAIADPAVRVILTPAHHAMALGGCGLDLVVNIASFQEMTPEIVAGYFDMIRANQAWHYNCNRLRKVLPAGEVLDFMSWDWEGAEIVLDELCPWHQRFYTYRPPFVRPYDGPAQHRLAKF